MENLPMPVAPAAALPYDITFYSTPNFSAPFPANALNWPVASRRLQLSPQEWEDLKPTIQQLYIDEGMTFKEVSLVLQTNHNFTPTKKQFDDKIKKWGLRKNATRSQRGMIVRELHNDDDVKAFQEAPFKLNPGKLERWEREEKLSGTLGKPAQGGKAVGASTSKTVVHRPPDRALSPLREILEIHSPTSDNIETSRTIWDMANIPGSPNLRGFFSAIKIDNKFPIPSLPSLPPRDPNFITKDQWSEIIKKPAHKTEGSMVQTSGNRRQATSHRQQFTVSEPYICQWLLSQIEKPWTPLNEVYPFPQTGKTRKPRNNTSILKASPVKQFWLEILESEEYLRRMEAIQLPDERSHAGLVAEMHYLANLYSKAGQYGLAEPLHRRVALARQETLGPCDPETLHSYLSVIETKIAQSEYFEAATLQRDLDAKIRKLFHPTHEVALRSRSLLGSVLVYTQNFEEGEVTYRELLQISLNEFGQRNEMTYRAMSNLGNTIRCRREHAASEELLQTSLQILGQVVGDVEEHYYYSKMYLGKALQKQERYAESCSLLKDAVRLSMAIYGMGEHPAMLTGLTWLATSLAMKGDLEESDIFLSTNLRIFHRMGGLTNYDVLETVEQRGRLMEGCKMWSEAAIAYEHLFRAFSELHGPDHESMRWAFERLDNAYTMQGLYKDESDFYAQLDSVLDSTEDPWPRILTSKRKHRQPRAEEADEASDEVEEIRPCKKPRKMTCTYNLKARAE